MPAPEKIHIPLVIGRYSVILYLISLSLPLYSNIFMIILSIGGIFGGIFCINRISLSSPILIAILAFMLSGIISSFTSVNFNRTFLLSLSFLPALLIFFLIAELFEAETAHLILKSFCLISLIISVTALRTFCMSENTDPSVWIHEIGNPYLLVPNDLILLPILIPFLLVIIHSNPASFFGILSVLTIILNVAVITIFQSRGCMILSIMSICCFGLIYQSRYILPIVVIIIVLIIVIDCMRGFLFISKLGGVWHSRIPAWIAAWSMFTDSPLIGHGPRSFGELYAEYQLKLSLPEWLVVDRRIMPWAHNLYLETLAEQGIIGLTIFMLMIKHILSSIFVLLKSSSEYINLLGKSVFSSLIIILVGNMFELSFIRHWFVIFFFVIISFIVTLSNFTDTEERI